MLPPAQASHRVWKPLAGKRPIAVMMSGGVDSSLTAAILQEAGWDVVGVTMLVPSACGGGSPCCGAHAADVCAEMGIAHYLFDTHQAFFEAVISPFRASYAIGATPSPCIDCNTRLKFGLLAQAIYEQLGIQHLATGHYVRIERSAEGVFLARARAHAKDQSYFLYGIPRGLLDYLYCPLGDWEKQEVRNQARQRGIHVAERQDSQDLCFAGEGDYRQALQGQGQEPGDIVDQAGRVLGQHKGIAHYTIGQRHGLGLGHHQPHFVLAIDAEQRRLVVGQRQDAYRHRIQLQHCHILQERHFIEGQSCGVKFRSGGDPRPCVLQKIEGTDCLVDCEEAVFAPAPGQHAVFYDAQDRVIAGGIIAS